MRRSARAGAGDKKRSAAEAEAKRSEVERNIWWQQSAPFPSLWLIIDALEVENIAEQAGARVEQQHEGSRDASTI